MGTARITDIVRVQFFYIYLFMYFFNKVRDVSNKN